MRGSGFLVGTLIFYISDLEKLRSAKCNPHFFFSKGGGINSPTLLVEIMFVSKAIKFHFKGS